MKCRVFLFYFLVSTDIQMYINNSLPYGKPNAKRKNY